MKTMPEAHTAPHPHARRRTPRRAAMALAGALAAALALVALPAAASAATPEMRGEWALTMSSNGMTVHGTALITQEANGSGEFEAEQMFFEGSDPGTFTGTLGATEASVKVTGQAYGPFPATEFTSSTMQIQSSGSSLSLSGSGTVHSGSVTAPGTLTATRVKTYQEIEEQHQHEQRERELAEQREAVAGEWALTLQSGSEELHGVARITKPAGSQNEFASSSALFEGALAGSFAGTLEGPTASVTVTTQASGPYPATTFTSSSIAVTLTSSSMSMSGSGTFQAGGMSVPATLTATRTKDYSELLQLQAQERLAQEAKEKEATEAQEKLEREAAQKRELQAREKAAKEASEKAEKEAQEKRKSEETQSTATATTLPLRLDSKAAKTTSSGWLWLMVSNPNSSAVHARLVLLVGSGAHSGTARHTAGAATVNGNGGSKGPSKGKGKGNGTSKGKSKGKGKPHSQTAHRWTTLGAVSFSIGASGRMAVHIELSRAGRAALAHQSTLHVLAALSIDTATSTHVSKEYKLTLHAPSQMAPSHAHAKH